MSKGRELLNIEAKKAKLTAIQIFMQLDLPGNELRVLMCITADKEEYNSSQSEISQKTSIPAKSVERALKQLTAKGFIKTLEKGTFGRKSKREINAEKIMVECPAQREMCTTLQGDLNTTTNTSLEGGTYPPYRGEYIPPVGALNTTMEEGRTYMTYKETYKDTYKEQLPLSVKEEVTRDGSKEEATSNGSKEEASNGSEDGDDSSKWSIFDLPIHLQLMLAAKFDGPGLLGDDWDD